MSAFERGTAGALNWIPSGGWIQTYTGAKVYPLDPNPVDIRLLDIAHALSHLCRYTGHSKSFYSVAQHCVHVSELVPAHAKLYALLHDGSEAFLQDIPAPLKHTPEFAFYRDAEARMERCIWQAFDLPPPDEATLNLVKQADLQILATEASQLLAPLHKDWKLPCEPLKMIIEPWSPDEARRVFLETFKELNYRHQLRSGTWG